MRRRYCGTMKAMADQDNVLDFCAAAQKRGVPARKLRKMARRNGQRTGNKIRPVKSLPDTPSRAQVAQQRLAAPHESRPPLDVKTMIKLGLMPAVIMCMILAVAICGFLALFALALGAPGISVPLAMCAGAGLGAGIGVLWFTVEAVSHDLIKTEPRGGWSKTSD